MWTATQNERYGLDMGKQNRKRRKDTRQLLSKSRTPFRRCANTLLIIAIATVPLSPYIVRLFVNWSFLNLILLLLCFALICVISAAAVRRL